MHIATSLTQAAAFLRAFGLCARLGMLFIIMLNHFGAFVLSRLGDDGKWRPE